MTKVLLDTTVFVAIERGKASLASVTTPDDADIALSVVTVAELRYGMERADKAHRARRMQFVQQVVKTFEIVDYTIPVAFVHARLAATTNARGVIRGRADLMIAASAAQTGRILITADQGFESIPELRLRLINT